METIKYCKCGCRNLLTNNGNYIKGHNGKRGKSYEEIYGKEKAKKIKELQSRNNKKINLGKTHEEMFGKNKSKKIKDEISKRQKGILYEERFGKEKAKLIKLKISKNSKGKNSGTFEERFGKERAIIEKQKRSKALKGKKYNERYGKKRAEEIKLKLSKKLKGLNLIHNDLIIQTFQQMFDTLGGMYKSEWDIYMFCNEQTVRNKFGNLDNLAKIANREFKISNKGKFGKNETKILNIIEKDNNINLERQKRITIKNKRYYLDGYDPINNIVYEVDERYHKFNKEYDLIRENKLKQKLKCNIKRINEQQFLNMINQTTLQNFGELKNA